MAEQRTYQGATYERDTPAQPWRLVGEASDGGSPGVIVPAAPPAPPTGYRPAPGGLAPIPGGPADRMEPPSGYRYRADGSLEAIPGGPAATTTDPRNARIATQLQTDSVLGALTVARRQIGEGWNTGNVAGTGFFQGIPIAGQSSANLAATLSGIQGSIINDVLQRMRAQSSTGASGFGSLTETEAARLAASVGALQQTQDADSLARNLARVERHYRNALALLNNEDPREPQVAERYGIITNPEATAAPVRGNQLTAEGHPETDPGLAGLNASVSRMIREGKSEADIRAYLNRVRPGMGDATVNLRQNIEYSRQNPDRDPGVTIEEAWRPTTGFQQTMGEFGMTPVGSAVVGGADMLTGGTLDNLTDNPDLTRAVMGGLQERNPGSYLTGQVAGGVLGSLGGEAALARGGLTGLARMRTGDALLGATYGAGSADEPDDSRIGGAIMGGTAGLLGGMAGRGAARTVGRAATGVTDAARLRLNEADVPLTVGQLLGGTAARTEDRLAGLPFVGDQIRNRRIEGLEGFNRAAFDEGLAPINASTGGVIAEPGVDLARAARSQAYDTALDPVRVQADAPFVTDMQATIAAGQALPSPMREAMDYTIPTRVGEAFDPQGGLTGRDYQQALRGLRRDASSLERQPFGYDFGQVARQAEDSLEGILTRQSPETVPALLAANEGNRNVEVIRAAVNAARNGTRTGETGVFSPSQLADAAAQNARRFGNTQGTTQQPFFDLSRAGQEVLPSSVPDSGTTGRALLPAVMLGLASGGGTYATGDEDGSAPVGSNAAMGTMIGLMLAAPYSRPARAALQRLLMAERPAVVGRAGQELLERNRIAGLLAAPAAVVAGTGQ